MLLYALPAVPPVGLPNPGSLNTDPGAAPALPGVESWPEEFRVFWQVLPGGPAYAGAAAAPVMTMPARQLAAKSVRIMITFHSGRAPSRTLYFEDGRDRHRVRNAFENFCTRPLARSTAAQARQLAAALMAAANEADGLT
jgi:hypothetical protein